MATEIKINIGVDGVTLETGFGLGAWSKDHLSFNYGGWSVLVESDDIDYTDFDLTLQFTDDGRILFTCDSYHCEKEEEYNGEEIEEDADECCEYKNFEITGNFEMQSDYFFIKFVKVKKL
jgi:hypothetical protein